MMTFYSLRNCQIFTPKNSSDSSVDTTCEVSVDRSILATANRSESPQVQSSSETLPNSSCFRPRLQPGVYQEKDIRNKVPTKVRCVPVSEPPVLSNQLTHSRKWVVIIDSCQKTRTLHSSSEFYTSPHEQNTCNTFEYSAQSTPPGYWKHQKDLKHATLHKIYGNVYQNIVM